MKKTLPGVLIIPFILFCLSGCSYIGEKTASISVIYAVTSILSLILLIGYCCFIKKKEIWFLLLFASVFVVNTGYFTLSVSNTVSEALLANRISYLGSVFLPLSMLMSIINISKLNYKKWLSGILLLITTVVFIIAASPGYLDIYYKEVSLEVVNGASVLKKEYGEWHCVYLYYLLSYFSLMIAITLHSIKIKKISSGIQSVMILIAVFVNICVWLLEQLIDVNFEFLSVSYIASELFLIGLYSMLQDNNKEESNKADIENTDKTELSENTSDESFEHCDYIEQNISSLTATERKVYDCYIAGKTTKEVLQELNITENTLKYHNKNIYAKLGVSSRKQLLEYVNSYKNKG